MKSALILLAAVVLLDGCRSVPEIPIHDAAGRRGNIEAVKKQFRDCFLCNDVDVRDGYGRTPLHHAAIFGRKEIVKMLIAKGADENAMNYENETPLDWAITAYVKGSKLDASSRNNLGEIASFLRKNGAKTGKELEAAGK